MENNDIKEDSTRKILKKVKIIVTFDYDIRLNISSKIIEMLSVLLRMAD